MSSIAIQLLLKEELVLLLKELVKGYDGLDGRVKEALAALLAVNDELLAKAARLLAEGNLRIEATDEASLKAAWDLVKLVSCRLSCELHLTAEYEASTDALKLVALSLSMEPARGHERYRQLVRELAKLHSLKKSLEASHLMSLTRPKGRLVRLDYRSVYDLIKEREGEITGELRRLGVLPYEEYVRAVEGPPATGRVILNVALPQEPSIYAYLDLLRKSLKPQLPPSEAPEVCERLDKRRCNIALKVQDPYDVLVKAEPWRSEVQPDVPEMLETLSNLLGVEPPEGCIKLIRELHRRVEEGGIDPVEHVEQGYFRWINALKREDGMYADAVKKLSCGKAVDGRKVSLLLMYFYVLSSLLLYEVVRDPCGLEAGFVPKYKNLLGELNNIIEAIRTPLPKWLPKSEERRLDEVERAAKGLEEFEELKRVLEGLTHLLSGLEVLLRYATERGRPGTLFSRLSASFTPSEVEVTWTVDDLQLKLILNELGLLLAHSEGERRLAGLAHLAGGAELSELGKRLRERLGEVREEAALNERAKLYRVRVEGRPRWQLAEPGPGRVLPLFGVRPQQ